MKKLYKLLLNNSVLHHPAFIFQFSTTFSLTESTSTGLANGTTRILFIFILLLTILCFVTMLKAIQNITNFYYFIFGLTIISLIFYNSPILMLFFTLTISILSLQLVFSDFFSTYLHNKLNSDKLLALLSEFNLLNFFFKIYSIVFNQLSPERFILFSFSSHILSFSYVLLYRYFIFFTFVSPVLFTWESAFIIFFSIFISLYGLLLRGLINFSILLVHTISLNNSFLYSKFLKTNPEFDPESNPMAKSHWSILSRYNTTTNHYHGNIRPPRINLWRGLGFTIGVCTLGVSCYVAYQTRLSYLEAFRANQLKRYELAKLYPQDASYIFRDYPEEYKAFKAREQ